MKRDDALKVLAEHYPEGVVVAVYQSAFDWMHIRPHPLNYVSTGAMGQASSHALGLALGAPNEKILVLDGDGSLLMNLGSLITIGNLAPKNLIHFVSHNKMYEVNGNFPIPAADAVQFDQIAKVAGYKNVFSFKNLEDFESKIERVLNAVGPVFVSMHWQPGKTYPRDYAYIHSAEVRTIFRDTFRKKLHQQ